jgi:hypothetical protein
MTILMPLIMQQKKMAATLQDLTGRKFDVVLQRPEVLDV